MAGRELVHVTAQANARAVRVLLGAATLLGAVALPGCGWTARDSFYQARKVTFQPAAGDGSVVVFSPEPSWPAARPGTSVAAAPDR